MPPDLITKTANYVKMRLEGEMGAHDWWHIERVWKMAKHLQSKEGGDSELVELSALLHDLGHNRQLDVLEKIKGPLMLRGMMDILEIEPERQEQMINIITEIQYLGSETKVPATLEGKIVQDADLLESIGAIGMARSFTMGGIVGRPIYDPRRKIRKKLSKEEYLYKKKEGTTFNYFYEKLLRLPEMMNTKTAKELAEGRAKFIEQFAAEFLAECELKK